MSTGKLNRVTHDHLADLLTEGEGKKEPEKVKPPEQEGGAKWGETQRGTVMKEALSVSSSAGNRKSGLKMGRFG